MSTTSPPRLIPSSSSSQQGGNLDQHQQHMSQSPIDMAVSPGMSPTFPSYMTNAARKQQPGHTPQHAALDLPPPNPRPKTSLMQAFKSEAPPPRNANNPYNTPSSLPPPPLPSPSDLPTVSAFVSAALGSPPPNAHYTQLLQQLRGRKEPKMLWRLLLCLGRGR